MQEHQGSRRADHVLLTGDILIAGDSGFADDSQVSTGYESSPTHFRCDFLRKIHQLYIECPSWVDGRVLMGVLCRNGFAGHFGWEGNVQKVVVQ